MNWIRLSRGASQKRFAEMVATNDFAPGDMTHEYRILRADLRAAIPQYATWEGSKFSYDFEVGLALHRILSTHKFGVRSAADDDVWRYLSLIVVPEIVSARWPDVKAARFWQVRSRIWLRVMWWFVHLSWQGSEAETRRAVQGMTTDSVLQLVDRSGKGYRVDLCRELVWSAGKKGGDESFFRRLMKLNTARVVMVEPTLYPNGIKGYARSLYDRLDQPGIGATR